MSGRHLPVIALAATLAVGTALAAAQGEGELRALFSHQAAIRAERGGLVRLPLPPQVLALCSADLRDLRVFDARERELPFLVDSGRRPDEAIAVRRTFTPRVLGLSREQSEPEGRQLLTREIYAIEAPSGPPEGEHWELVFDVHWARFVREVRVSHGPAQQGEQVLASGSIFRLDAETERVRLPLLPLPARKLRVELSGAEEFYLEPSFRFESARNLDALERSSVRLDESAREQRDGLTVITLERPGGIVPDLLRVDTATGSFSRRLRVWDERPGGADALLGGGRVFRVAVDPPVDRLELGLAPARGAALRVEVEDGDSPPLEKLRFFAVVRRPVLVFELADAGVATLRFGGGRTRAPRYDLAALRLGPSRALRGAPAEGAARLHDPELLVEARLGAVGPSPFYTDTPALAFARRPGATVDARAWSHRRPVTLEPSPEGLARLPLAIEDVAHARADLADVRVVDDAGHQWPYLLQADAHREEVLLLSGPPETRRKVSRYTLELPAAPLRLDGVILRTSAPYLDRAYELEATLDGGRREVIARGRIEVDARDPRPIRISFAPRHVRELELAVEDGDDAPLRFEEARGRARLPELFLVAPIGRYDLLLGNPDVAPPSYELVRVRELVLAARSGVAEAGALEANPAYTLAARLGGEDGPSPLLRTAALWAVLLIAVAVLALVTLRVARRESPPADAPAGDEQA